MKVRKEMNQSSTDLVERSLLIFGAIWSVSMTFYISSIENRIELQIKQGLVAQSNLHLRYVDCPGDLRLLVEKTLTCVAESTSFKTFSVFVSRDVGGSLQWAIPLSNQVINLVELEQHFQQILTSQTGLQTVVYCDGDYRPNNTGDFFKCKVMRVNQTSEIEVWVDQNNNINWQEVLAS